MSLRTDAPIQKWQEWFEELYLDMIKNRKFIEAIVIAKNGMNRMERGQLIVRLAKKLEVEPVDVVNFVVGRGSWRDKTKLAGIKHGV